MANRGQAQYTRGNVGINDDYFHMIIPEGIYFRNGAGWASDVRLNKAGLGNARTDQVSNGVTFTSSNGVKITWTLTCMMPNNILIVYNESVLLNWKCYNHESLIHWEEGNFDDWTFPGCLSKSMNSDSEWHEYNVDECFNFNFFKSLDYSN